MTLNVKVTNKIASFQQDGNELPVCGNSGYKVAFEFDEEWGGYEQKTARFIWGGKYHDVEFTGNTCDVPVVSNTTNIAVGVYAGEMQDDGYMLSTTLATIPFLISARCGNRGAQPTTGADYTNEARGYAAQAKEAEKTAQEVAKAAQVVAEGAQEAKETAQAAAQLAQDTMSTLEDYKGMSKVGEFTITQGTTLHSKYGFVISDGANKLTLNAKLLQFRAADGARVTLPIIRGYLSDFGASVNYANGNHYLKVDEHLTERINKIGDCRVLGYT